MARLGLVFIFFIMPRRKHIPQSDRRAIVARLVDPNAIATSSMKGARNVDGGTVKNTWRSSTIRYEGAWEQ